MAKYQSLLLGMAVNFLDVKTKQFTTQNVELLHEHVKVVIIH